MQIGTITIAADSPANPAGTKARIYQKYSIIQPVLLALVFLLCYYEANGISRVERLAVKKQCWIALAAGAATGAWGICQNGKYHLRPEL